MEIKVKKAKISDVESISELYSEFFAYNAFLQPEYYTAATDNGGYPRSVIANSEALLLVAEVGGITSGLLHAEIRRTPPYACFVQHTYAEVVDLFVTERLRGNGIGNALLAGAEQWSDNHNLDYLELSVLQNNDRAIKFYTNHKFKCVSHLIRK